MDSLSSSVSNPNVETLLRCPICFDFLNITMMTKCSHNFCSLCIRKFLSYKLQCPVCNRVRIMASDLKLIFIPATSPLAAKRPSECCRSWFNKAIRTTSSAYSRDEILWSFNQTPPDCT
uniref:RING-type domain-containing protein n=1 Tax=Periophthalmus magnuspinnatus TaxID=409849 RepID=A0A3B4AGL1_9GOBI